MKKMLRRINKNKILEKIQIHRDDVKAFAYLLLGITLFWWLVSYQDNNILLFSRTQWIFGFSIYAVTHWAAMKKYKPDHVWTKRTVYEKAISIYSMAIVGIFLLIFSLSAG